MAGAGHPGLDPVLTTVDEGRRGHQRLGVREHDLHVVDAVGVGVHQLAAGLGADKILEGTGRLAVVEAGEVAGAALGSGEDGHHVVVLELRC